jgi:hypothetical protein
VAGDHGHNAEQAQPRVVLHNIIREIGQACDGKIKQTVTIAERFFNKI